MICIVDYGLGNIGSLVNMCKFIGLDAQVASDQETIAHATHLILPGVGTFDTGMKNLQERGLIEILNEEVQQKKKRILGICLGAQLMLKSSEEGERPGLGWIDGSVVRFDDSKGIKVPHMGWNNLYDTGNHILYENMPDEVPRFYFVHSYYFRLNNLSDIAASTVYGDKFTSSFIHGNIFGVQFHPEKSHKFGISLLRNFYEKS